MFQKQVSDVKIKDIGTDDDVEINVVYVDSRFECSAMKESCENRVRTTSNKEQIFSLARAPGALIRLIIIPLSYL